MRITLALGSLQVGGTERQVCRLASELQTRGHDVQVICLGSTGPLEQRLRDDGIEPVMIGFRRSHLSDENGRVRVWRAIPELIKLVRIWRALREHRPDACHAFLYWAYVLVLPVAALARVPVRVSGRRGLGRQPPRGQWLFDLLERGVNRLTHLVVCNSRAVADKTVRADHVRRSKIRVIPNGIDLPDEPADVEREPPVGVMVANLIAYKGHADLLRALAAMRDPPRIRLLGEGPERTVLEGLAVELGVDGAVVFEGFHSRPEEAVADSQFAVLTSREEGFPNAVLEVMAFGLPVVATRVGGVPELLDETAGRLVPTHSPEAIARALEEIAGDPALRRELGQAGRDRAREFTWPRCVDAHLSLYSTVQIGG